MGYTHYWSFGNFISEKNYKQALTACRKIVRDCGVRLAGPDGTGNPVLRNGLAFNGVEADSYETFGFDMQPAGKEDFCKTAVKPYDVVVVACLCALQEHLGKSVMVTSDGDPHEWEDGRRLAEKVLGRSIRIPQSVVDQLNFYGWYARSYREKHPEYNYTPLDKSHPNHRKEQVPDYAKG